MVKKYNLKQMDKAFRINTGYGGFPTTCIKCDNALKSNDDFDYNSEWTASYTCVSCGAKYAYQPSDMGQTLPWIVKYDHKEEVFK